MKIVSSLQTWRVKKRTPKEIPFRIMDRGLSIQNDVREQRGSCEPKRCMWVVLAEQKKRFYLSIISLSSREYPCTDPQVWETLWIPGPRACGGESKTIRGLSSDGDLFVGTSNQPLQNGIQVCFFFGTDTIATHLAMGYTFQIQRFNQFVHG